MNYFEFHLGDYIRDTAHLTMVEDAAYRRLLDIYYVRETALPRDPKACAKLCRASSKSELDAVAYVLREFFILAEDGYHNPRADREIARVAGKKGKAKAAANARWSHHRNGCSVDASASPEQCHGDADAMPPARGSIRQSPVTNNQPIASGIGISTDDTPAATVCARLLEAGITNANPTHPKLVKLLDAGLSVDEIASIGPEAMEKGKGFAWLLGAAEGRRRDAAAVPSLPSVSAADAQWWKTDAGIERRGRELGMTSHPGETYTDYRHRISERLQQDSGAHNAA